ncbi:MAG: sodium:solute symporter family protein [Armatimonadetes bacterium]|nr:sodium:solute symporter family protein [Armatimonadota bacterium]
MSHFTWIDGIIVGLYLLATMIAGIKVRKYVGKVEHFLVAGREMNVYLGIASLAATEFGIVTCMYTAQNGYDKGFAGATPGFLAALAMLLVGLTGFCIKPLRDSGSITIPELFQKRYGSNVRWMSGVVIVLGGLLNMGVFLRVGGEFLVHTIGFEPKYLVITMATLIIGVSIYTIMGGMLSVLVTDFLQFVVMSGGLLVITALILWKVGWTALVGAVETHYHAGGFNPFVNETMGWQYVLFNAILAVATVLTWQTVVVRVLAAKDTRTGRKVYTGTSFFLVCRFLIPGIWGIAALATVPAAAVSKHTLDAMPMFLSTIVPTGLMGIIVAAMLAADMSTDSSYMLTWGSVIYNDIMAPFRKGQWSEKRGLRWNRMIIACIGVFLLFFGLIYQPKTDLWTYLGVTGSIYLSSMSVLLIACCYWKKANNWGAIGAIAFGATIPVLNLTLERNPQVYVQLADLFHVTTKKLPYCLGISSYVIAALAMITGSLLKPASEKPAETVEVRQEAKV